MKITEIIDDIFSDIRTADKRHEDFLRDTGVPFYKYRARRSSAGLWAVLLPNIVGFVLGLAVTRLLGFNGIAYIIIGAVFAFAVGTFKSVEFDKISLKPALVRNAIIMALISGIGTLAVVFGDK